ncbi:MAG TPA: DUF3105 domain-containing protein [Acidimicrobiales bacterium]|nr:DUF3105 domain-containing protein [Acidimicrobiales bacterium]
MLRRAAAVILAASMLALAACGGGGGGDDDGAAAGEGSGRPTSGGVSAGPAAEGVEGVEAYRIDSRNHTEDDLDYDQDPPAGGDHSPVPATCGYYDTLEARPPDEFMVHDLEHGAVWIAFDPDLPDGQRDILRDVVARQAKVTATPYADLDSPLVVTAWGRKLPLDSADDPRLAQFIDTYRNSAEAPEATAACQGIGEPEVTAPAA